MNKVDFKNKIVPAMISVVLFCFCSKANAYNYEFRNYQPQNIFREVVELYAGAGVGIVGGKQITKFMNSKYLGKKALDKETLEAIEMVLTEMNTILGTEGAYTPDILFDMLEKEMRVGTGEFFIDDRHVNEKPKEEKTFWQKTGNFLTRVSTAMDDGVTENVQTLKTVLDYTVFPAIEIAGITDPSLKIVAGTSDFIIDEVLLMKASMKQQDNTRKFYRAALLEIDALQKALRNKLSYYEEQYSGNPIYAEFMAEQIDLAQKEMRILEDHLTIHKNNLSKFHPKYELSAKDKNEMTEDIDTLTARAYDFHNLANKEHEKYLALERARKKEERFWDDQHTALLDLIEEYASYYASQELTAWANQYWDDITERKRQLDTETARTEIAKTVGKWKADVAKTLPNRIKTGEWEGGMIGVSLDATQWWSRRSSGSVTATPSKSGKTLTFTLNHPDTQQPTRFKVDTTATTRIVDRDLYKGDIDFLNFSTNDSISRAFYTNGAQDFFRFEWFKRNEGVHGYYGERIHAQSQLPTSGVSTYRLVQERVITELGNRLFLTGYGADMKLFVDWKTGTVYGIDASSPSYWGSLGKDVFGSDEGPTLYIGKLDRDSFSITGRYVSKPNFAQLRHARGLTPEISSLQLYGKDRPNGIGGTFTTMLYDEKGDASRGTAQMSGFRDGFSSHRPEDQEKNWYGFASGLFVNRKTGEVDVAYNNDFGHVSMYFRPDEGTVQAGIYVGKDGSSDLDYKFYSTGQNSVYINKDAFAALEDLDGVPSYAATAMDSDRNYYYLSWGVWNAEQVGAPDIAMANGSHWIAGALTSSAQMPKTGTASYEGPVHGAVYQSHPGTSGGNASSGWATPGFPDAIHTLTGTSTLTANFSTGKVSGSLTMNYADDNGVHAGGDHYATANLKNNVSITGRHFEGDLGGTGITSGKINGAFYGSPAGEIGGNWHIKKAGSQAVGVFAGREVRDVIP